MPTPVKTLDNMSKHLTREELAARGAAEAAALPCRPLKRPKLISRDKAASRHWSRILKDMDGLDILDILDADALAIYCAKLARRDDLQARYLELRTEYDADADPVRRNGVLKLMIKLSSELQAVEAQLLAYAGKLGLTPESRLRMARRAAEPDADDPNADLFG